MIKKNILLFSFATLTVTSMLSGCFISSRSAAQEQNTPREQVCSTLKNQITFDKSDSHFGVTGSNQHALPTENARMIRSYDKNNCVELENEQKLKQ